jgi:hypothetical protein
MSEKFTATEESIREVLTSLRAERVMSKRGLSTGLQTSSTRGVKSSPLTARAGTSRVGAERRTKHKNDMASTKLVPFILPTYIPPLSGAINRDNAPREFEYTLVTAYLLKRVRAVCVDHNKIAALNFSDFNLGDHKVYNMLSRYKYRTRTKGKNSKIVPQQWTMNLTQSTLLNVMKIPHFSKH